MGLISTVLVLCNAIAVLFLFLVWLWMSWFRVNRYCHGLGHKDLPSLTIKDAICHLHRPWSISICMSWNYEFVCTLYCTLLIVIILSFCISFIYFSDSLCTSSSQVHTEFWCELGKCRCSCVRSHSHTAPSNNTHHPKQQHHIHTTYIYMYMLILNTVKYCMNFNIEDKNEINLPYLLLDLQFNDFPCWADL